MPKLDLSQAIQIKGLGLPEITSLKGVGFSWQKPSAPAFDPEAGLTLTRSLVESSNINVSQFNRIGDVVFAVDITGLDGSAGGIIMEVGAPFLGAYIGFRADGTFVARCGTGTDTASPGVNTSIIELSGGSSIVTGAGTLVVEIQHSPQAIRAWWNGVPLGTPQNAGTSGTHWAGTDPGGFFVRGNNMVVGEIDTALPRASNSDLRVYADQLVL